MSGCIPGVILRAWQQDLQDNGFRKDRVVFQGVQAAGKM